MKIGFVGNFGVSFSSESHHAKSLEFLGHEVVRLQEGKVNGQMILRSTQDCQLLIWVHTHGWRTAAGDKVLHEMKRRGIPTLTYHLDLWLGISRQRDLEKDPFYKNIDYFFTVDKLMADWFNENTNVKGCYIPAGVFGEECYMKEPSDKKYDVIFVGSKGYHHEWAYRPQLIDWLRETYGDRFTHVGGDGDTGTIRGDDLNQVYADSKIAIGDTLCLNFDYPYYYSDRLFETTGRGGFIIHPYIKGIEDQFDINSEIVAYDFGDFEQLKGLIDYYLEHDDERESIRLAGHERAKRDHTYIKRWEQILKEVFNG